METNASRNISINSTGPSWTHNSTQQPMMPQIAIVALAYVSIVICLLGLVGNVFMVWIFTFKIKKNYCTVYFLNMAVADLLYLLGCGLYAAYMLCLLEKMPTSVSNNQIIGYLSETLTNVGFDSSTFLLTAVSAERCLTVLCPLYNRLQHPRHQTYVVCIAIWCLSLLTMALEVFICDDRGDFLSPGAERCVPVIIFTTILFIIMLLLMVISCLTLLGEIQKSSAACRPQRLYVIILLSLFAFFIEMVPARLLSLLIYFRVVSAKTYSLVFYFIRSICTAIYCASNPVFNVFVGRWRERSSFKAAMEKIFHVNS